MKFLSWIRTNAAAIFAISIPSPIFSVAIAMITKNDLNIAFAAGVMIIILLWFVVLLSLIFQEE